MILISAIPLKRGPLFNYRDDHFINKDKIVTATKGDDPDKVNVTLEDKSEWIISAEAFNVMRLFYTEEK